MIDFHVHVYPPEIIRDAETISKREPYFDALIHNKVHKWASVIDVLSAMKEDGEDGKDEEDGVERSVIFGFAFKDLGLCRLCNDYVIDAVKKYPEQLSGLCVVPPLGAEHSGAEHSEREKCAEREISRCAENGLIGVGELFPEGQGFDITDKIQTQKLAAILEELNLCLLLHTAEPVGHYYVGKGNVGPSEAAKFCLNHPNVKVIFAHLGGGLWLYELMPEMRKILRNAYYDLAALPWLYDPKILRAIKEAGVLEKILFGTDFPILPASRYKKIFDRAGLEAEDIETITRLNALKLIPRLNKAIDDKNID